MRVLLVNTNRNRFLTPPPVGLAYIAASLRREGFPFRVLDLMFCREPLRSLTEAIGEYRPDVIGYSVRNLDNQSMANCESPLPEIRGMVAAGRDSGAVTVLGGTAFTTLPVPVLDYMKADFGIAGQGEGSLCRLLDYLKAGGDPGMVPGLVWREGETVRMNTPDMGGYSGRISPDWDAIDISRYRKSVWPVTVIVKSGCAYNCSYCDAHSTFGHSFHPRETEDILDEICRVIRDYGIRVFYLSDPCFNAGPAGARALLEGIIRRNLRISFSTTLMPVSGTYDDEYISLYRRAGGTFAILGVETFSERMLKNYRKPFTISDVYECAMLARRRGITFGLELLIGGPGENESTVRESMAFLPHITASLLLYSVGIRILPDTDIYRRALDEGFVSPDDDLLFPRFYVSGELDVPWAQRFIRRSLRHYWYRRLGMVPCGLRNALARYWGIIL